MSVFFIPAFPRTFKNFEVICEACKYLDSINVGVYKVIQTMAGTENKYASYIVNKYAGLKNVEFCRLHSKGSVFSIYANTDCLLFPSKLETWGFPISKFAKLNKPMLIADLPYAHETSAGASKVCFFNPDDAVELACKMKHVIDEDFSLFLAFLWLRCLNLMQHRGNHCMTFY